MTEETEDVIVLMTLKMEEESKHQGMQVVSRGWKRQGHRFSPGASRRSTALHTP